MTFLLAPGISFCEPQGQRIFLDLAHDRYFALGKAADDAFTRLTRGDRLSNEDRARLAHLEAGGILRPSKSDGRPSGCAATSVDSAILDEPDLPVIPTLMMLRAAIMLRRAKADVERIPLGRLCASFVAGKTDLRASPSPVALASMARAFQAASRLIGTLDHCLAVSLALGRFAVARHFAADVVLGVKARPFHAHAWAQVGGIVLSDHLDNVRPYTPILVV